MNKRKVGLTLTIVSLSVFVFTLVNHILEIRAINECANTPGCMYCIPFWSVFSFFIYLIVLILLLLGLIFLFDNKQKKSV